MKISVSQAFCEDEDIEIHICVYLNIKFSA